MPTIKHRRPKILLQVLLILLVAFILRTHRLGEPNLTGDEAFSVVEWSKPTIPDLLTITATIDPQPAGALLLFRVWMMASGTTELALRILPAILSLLVVACAYRISRTYTNHGSSLAVTFLIALNPFQLWFAQEFRPYALWMATSALALTSIQLYIRSRKKNTLIVYILLQTTALYSFYLEVFFWLATNIAILLQVRQDRPYLFRWLFAQIAVSTLVAPWYLHLALQHSSYQPTAGVPNIPITLSAFMFGEFPNTPYFVPIFLTATILLLTSYSFVFHRQHSIKLLLMFFHIALPILLLVLLAVISHRGFYRPRYIAAVSLPLTIFLFLLFPTSGRNLRCIHLTAMLLLILPIITPTIHYFYDPLVSKAPNWRALVDRLQQASSDDIIIQNYPDPAFTYYYHGQAQVTLLPTTPTSATTDTQRLTQSIIEKHAYVWFIPVQSDAWDKQQVVAQTLKSDAQLISHDFIFPFNLYQYTSWDVASTTIPDNIRINYPDLVSLVGWRLSPSYDTWQPGDTIILELFWRPTGLSNTPLTVFTHLDGPVQPNGATLYAQDDYPPQDGKTSTTSWQLYKIIRDTYTLTIPPTAPAGTYQINIGLYNPHTMQQIPTETQNTSILITTFLLH